MHTGLATAVSITKHTVVCLTFSLHTNGIVTLSLHTNTVTHPKNAIASRDDTKRELAWLVTQARKGNIPNDIFEQQASALKDELAAKERYAQQTETELENACNNQTRAEQIAYSATVLRENVRVHSSILNYLHLACPQGSPLIEAYRQKLDEAAETVKDTVDDLIDSIIVMPDSKLVINYNFPLIDNIRSRQLTIAS